MLLIMCCVLRGGRGNIVTSVGREWVSPEGWNMSKVKHLAGAPPWMSSAEWEVVFVQMAMRRELPSLSLSRSLGVGSTQGSLGCTQDTLCRREAGRMLSPPYISLSGTEPHCLLSIAYNCVLMPYSDYCSVCLRFAYREGMVPVLSHYLLHHSQSISQRK